MSDAVKMQNSHKVSFYSGRSQILLAVNRHIPFHSSVDTPNSEI